MSNRYVLGTDERPPWADGAAVSGKRLAEATEYDLGMRLIVKRGTPQAEIDAYFDALVDKCIDRNNFTFHWLEECVP